MVFSSFTPPHLANYILAKAILIKFTLAMCLSIISLTSLANNVQRVTTERADQLLFYPEQKATALSKAINHAHVPAQISAQVANINVQLGSVVAKGQVLVNLDCQDKKINLTAKKSQQVMAKAQLRLAKRNFVRAEKLKKKNHIGEAELDESEVNVTIAHEKLRQVNSDEKSAVLAVQRCEVVAPFSGIVSERLVSEGDYVNTGQSLIKVLEKNNLEIEAQIPLDQMLKFRQAGQYNFISHGQKYPVDIKNVVDFIARNSRSQVVTFTLKNQQQSNANARVLAGMNGMISWQSQRSFLPAHLLTQRHGRYGVFVIASKDLTKGNTENKVAQFIALPNAQEGRPFTLNTEQEGISKESYLIIDGRHRVSDNTAVLVSKKAIDESLIKAKRD